VPEDVSVIGFDAVENAGGSGPRLTTMHIPYFGLGAAAMSMLLDIIAGSPVPARHLVIPARLILGSTTAAVPYETGI
jgi:LacI family transcriptional regulator